MEDAYRRLSPNTVDSHEANEIQKPTNKKIKVNEDKCWEDALNEYESDRKNKGLWTRLYVENNGEEDKTKIAYLKQRAEQLIQQEKEKYE